MERGNKIPTINFMETKVMLLLFPYKNTIIIYWSGAEVKYTFILISDLCFRYQAKKKNAENSNYSIFDYILRRF